MKIWEVEVWLQIKSHSPWENWANEQVVAETIEEAIEKAKAKQQGEWKPKQIQVRSAHLNVESTIE